MLPDFIGIGAQKAASSWLYFILREHPDVWVSPTKELHFFNLQENEYSHFHRVLFKKKGYKKSIKRFQHSPLHKPFWVLKYLFKKRDFNNYHKLFTPQKHQIAGEITPAYARLKPASIANVYRNLPNTKIIYILRNPIQRNWSSVCMSYENSKKETIESQTVQTLIEQITIPGRIAHSNYVKNFQQWKAHYPSNQIFIGFYDEIKNQPLEFLKRLFTFLELPSVEMSIFEKYFDQKVNSFSKNIPAEVLWAIAKSEYENILQAHNEFDNQYTKAWLEEANNILKKSIT